MQYVSVAYQIETGIFSSLYWTEVQACIRLFHKCIVVMTNLKWAKSISVDQKRKLWFSFPQPGPKMGLPACLTWPSCVLHNHPLVNGSRTPGDELWVLSNWLTRSLQIVQLLDLFKCWCSVIWIMHCEGLAKKCVMAKGDFDDDCYLMCHTDCCTLFHTN